MTHPAMPLNVCMKPSGWSAQAQWAVGKRLLRGVRRPCFLIGLALPLLTFAQSGRDAQQLTQFAHQTGAVMAMRPFCLR